MNSVERLRFRLHEVLEVAGEGDKLSRAFDLFVLTLIAANVLVATVSTVDHISEQYGAELRVFEVISVAIFTVEYILRLWACTAGERFRGMLRGRIKFIFSPMAIVDLLAILPFYLPVLGVDLRFVRALRLFRLFRMLKMARYSSSLQTLVSVLRSRKQQLVIALTFSLIMLLFASSVVYYVEHETRPHKFSSIPHAMWWGVCTLSTVGYGDIHPVTPVGKAFGGIIAFIGIGLFALPAGILAGGFAEWAEKHGDKSAAMTCPNCGERVTTAGTASPVRTRAPTPN